MKKVLIGMFCYLFSLLALATEEPAPLPPVDPKYMGEHPMVLVGNGSYVYASLLSKFTGIHQLQLIYDIDNKNLPLLNLVRDADLVTIKPKPFNLEHLLRGEKLTIEADVYMGHFERGGLLTYKNVQIVFDKQLYLRKLDEPEKSHIRHKYDSVVLNNNQRLLVHQIQTAPSYAQIILLFDDINCLTEFASSSAVPQQNEIYRKLSFCGSMRPLYYEYQDFEE
ncbi:hypothetical protein [Paraglaciecola sp. 25GB23A]|uniref:hypothetical protein n=1 Tax=Paraglaciecola sp. 25GB23A TaxID=3156068 RepID=UPI0032B00D25